MAKYLIDGGEYPSVTDITGLLDKSDALLGWACDCMATAIREGKAVEEARDAWKTVKGEALDIGSQTHDLIEHYIREGRDKSAVVQYPDAVQNAFLAFLDWEQQTGIEWLQAEKTICDPVRCYAGTLDAVAVLRAEHYVIDFKSSRGFYDGYDLQIAAYAAAEGLTHCGVLRLDKSTGLPEWRDYSDGFERYRDSFYHLLDFYYAYKRRRLRNPRTQKGD